MVCWRPGWWLELKKKKKKLKENTEKDSEA
jgi:hypothetical protein